MLNWISRNMCLAVRPYCCTDCTDLYSKPLSSISVLLSLEIYAEVAVLLLYGFLEIRATNQQSLSSIFVPKICPEINVEAIVRSSLKTVPLPRKMCPTLAVRIYALVTVPLCCCTTFAEVSISCSISPLCS